MTMKPLSGLRILEFDGLGPVTFAGMMLADLGADVLRLSRSAGAGAPVFSEVGGDVLHRGRASVRVNLKDADDRAAVLELVGAADALIEGFRPGVMERLGLGPGERRDVEQWRNFRVLTAILYLNAHDWSAEDGGMLRCYAPDAPPSAPCSLEVVPKGGTVAVFPSCTVAHEVFPARRPRYAITLWFVSGALLGGTPEERAAAAAATLADAAARRKRACAADADAKVERKRQRPLPSTPSPTPSSLAPPNTSHKAPPNTAHLAAAWEAAARCESQGGAFSFGFGP